MALRGGRPHLFEGWGRTLCLFGMQNGSRLAGCRGIWGPTAPTLKLAALTTVKPTYRRQPDGATRCASNGPGCRPQSDGRSHAAGLGSPGLRLAERLPRWFSQIRGCAVATQTLREARIRACFWARDGFSASAIDVILGREAARSDLYQGGAHLLLAVQRVDDRSRITGVTVHRADFWAVTKP